MFIEGIWHILIPLPENPLKALNGYIIPPSPDQPDGRALLIDTGFDCPESYQAISEGIHALGLKPEQLDILITHLHSDHSGQLNRLLAPGSRCYAGAVDGRLINEMTQTAYWENFTKLYTQLGLDVDQIGYLDHPGYKYCPKSPADFIYVKEGDQLAYGDFVLTVLDVPGHTPGQIVLWEAEKRILFSADHVLGHITPNISFWGFEYGDSLGVYLESLKKVRQLSPRLGLPAHRDFLHDVPGRIDEIAAHHEERLEEVLNILLKSETAQTPRAVAAQMHWTVRHKYFEDFPSFQKWFATAEAMSHLVHLAARNQAVMSFEAGVAYFSARQVSV